MIRKSADMVHEVRERMRGGAGSISIRHVFTKDEFTAPVRLCAQITIPPGAGIGPHTHATEDEVYIIMQGTGILDDGETQTRVNTGDAVLTGNGESHAISNDGGEPLEMMAFIAYYPEQDQ